MISCTFSLRRKQSQRLDRVLTNIVCLSRLRVWHKILPSSELTTGGEPLTVPSQRASLPSTMPSPSSAPFSTPSATFTTMESSRDCKYVCFPLSHPSSLHLLDRPENIPHFSNDSNSDIVIVNFPFPLTLFAHLLTKKKFCILPMSNSPFLPALLAMFPPES